MNGSDSLIRELFGIANCDLTSTDETVENGKRCKTIHLSYKGEVLGNARNARERPTATGDAT